MIPSSSSHFHFHKVFALVVIGLNCCFHALLAFTFVWSLRSYFSPPPSLPSASFFCSTAVREIALLKYLKHPNVVSLHDVIHMAEKLTMVFEFLELDLKKYLDVCGATGLELITVKSLLFQLLQGIAFCHKQKVLHRDLKPANLLLNRAGILKLADFGLARTFSMDVSSLKHEVITLWYRGPELLLGQTQYCTEVDMWSIGCIFAEMVNGKPLFPGASDAKQLETIISRLGTPTEQQWPQFTSMPLFKEAGITAHVEGQTLDQLVPRLKGDNDGLDLLASLLQYNPARRITAEAAMHHPFFAELKRKPRRQSSTATQAPQQQQQQQQPQVQQQQQQQQHYGMASTTTSSSGGMGSQGYPAHQHQQQQQQVVGAGDDMMK